MKKKLNKDALYHQLSDFLKGQGLPLSAGSMNNALKKSCEILTDAFNVTRNSLDRAKSQMEDTLDTVRNTIHEQTGVNKAARKSSGTGSGRRPATGKKAASKKSPAPAAARKKTKKTSGSSATQVKKGTAKSPVKSSAKRSTKKTAGGKVARKTPPKKSAVKNAAGSRKRASS